MLSQSINIFSKTAIVILAITLAVGCAWRNGSDSTRSDESSSGTMGDMDGQHWIPAAPAASRMASVSGDSEPLAPLTKPRDNPVAQGE